MSVADDHRNGDCWGGDRWAATEVEDADRRAMLAGSPVGVRVTDMDGDVWEHLGGDRWAATEVAGETMAPDDPNAFSIEHIDRTWGPVEVVT